VKDVGWFLLAMIVLAPMRGLRWLMTMVVWAMSGQWVPPRGPR
jgi:hypothetical protein